MEISDLLLLIGSVLAWMMLMLFSPLCAVWMTLPVLVWISWLVVKAMEEDE